MSKNDGGPAFPSVGEGFGKPQYSAPGMTLRRDIARAINRNSAEADSDTPDFVLANYLIACLDAWNSAMEARTFHFRPAPPTGEDGD